MKRNKSGISLIVLVITIIVMIILAGAIIISLSNSGIIGRAEEAVDVTNIKQIQQIAALAWSEAYIDKLEGKTVDMKSRVEKALEQNNVKPDNYVINVTDNGVEVLEKKLGSLIKSAADYGKTVDYTVTVDGKEHKDWQVYYEDETNGYVFLIASKVTETKSLTERSESNITDELSKLYSICSLGEPATLSAGNMYNYNESGAVVISLLTDYGAYANKTLYGDYVVGAMGGPTLKLLVAGWNAKGYTPTLTASGNSLSGLSEDGYISKDGLYITDEAHFIATPYSGMSTWIAQTAISLRGGSLSSSGLRPVICLKADTPAILGTTTNISLIK